ncbi:MAG TPA: glycosyltransferase [Pseudonocardia sp.]|nr:glycosyltransferase [Pseudonocardia sp.]
MSDDDAARGGPRLLVYSQDGLGLGHLRRTSTLITEVLAARPEVAVLTVSDSPLGRFFPTGGHHDYLKLPSIRKVGPGDWAAVALPMPFREVIALRRELLRAAAVRFRPNVVLVDHMPHGAMGELIPTLEALRATGARFVLGLRDILDAPEIIRRRWSVEGGYEAVDRYYDSVLVYGSRDVFDLPTEYGWPAAVASRVSFCGYVSSAAAPATDARRVRSRLLSALTPGVPSGRLVVATAGGGADAHPVFSRLLAAVPDILAERSCGFAIIAGPFMPEGDYEDLRRRATGLPVRVHRSLTNVPTYIAAADLVVSMAGYNTTVEILRSGRPGLLVPRSGPSAEQRLRADLFGARGWVRWLDPERLDRDAVAGAVTRALADTAEPDPRPAPDLCGSAVAAAALIGLVDEEGGSWPGAQGGGGAVAAPARL